MKGLPHNQYMILLLASTALAVFQLIMVIKWPRMARISLFLVFAWAGWASWNESQVSPWFYLEYGDLLWASKYGIFVSNWLTEHIGLVNGFIAGCQLLIGFCMLLKKTLFRAGAISAAIIMLAIFPLGVLKGFPYTIILAAALVKLDIKNNNKYIWEINHAYSYE
jgi:hypothetical protein